MTEVNWISTSDELSDFVSTKGRAVVLFTAPSWCRPCQQFEPHYARAAGEATDITFVAVDIDDNDWAVVDFEVRGVPKAMLYEDGQYLRDIKVPQGALPFLNDIRS